MARSKHQSKKSRGRKRRIACLGQCNFTSCPTQGACKQFIPSELSDFIPSILPKATPSLLNTTCRACGCHASLHLQDPITSDSGSSSDIEEPTVRFPSSWRSRLYTHFYYPNRTSYVIFIQGPFRSSSPLYHYNSPPSFFGSRLRCPFWHYTRTISSFRLFGYGGQTLWFTFYRP